MNLFYPQRTSFTLTWEDMNPNLKSIIVATGGFLIATLLIRLASFLYPEADFSTIGLLVVGSFSGVLSNFIKETIKV